MINKLFGIKRKRYCLGVGIFPYFHCPGIGKKKVQANFGVMSNRNCFSTIMSVSVWGCFELMVFGLAHIVQWVPTKSHKQYDNNESICLYGAFVVYDIYNTHLRRKGYDAKSLIENGRIVQLHHDFN